jgi:hypothetical protein
MAIRRPSGCLASMVLSYLEWKKTLTMITTIGKLDDYFMKSEAPKLPARIQN